MANVFNNIADDGLDDIRDPMVKKYIQSLNNRGNDDRAADMAYNTTVQNSQNNLLSNMAGSAAMMGSVGGKVASAAPLQQQMSGANAENDAQLKQGLGGMQGRQDKMDKVYQFLIDKQQKKEIADQTAANRRDTMTETNRHNGIVEAQTKASADASAAARDAAQGLRSDNASDKLKKSQDEDYIKLGEGIAKPKGSIVAQQAQTGLLNIAKAQDIYKRFPNYDDMPAAQAAQLFTELGKIASGGVGSEHGQKTMSSSSIQSALSEVMGKAENEPVGAKLGKFLQLNKNYLDDMEQTHHKIVNHFANQMFNARKNNLRPEQVKQFKAENPDYFQEEKVASTPPSQGGDGTALAAGGNNQLPQVGAGQVQRQMATPNAKQQQALDWLAVNGTKPMASEVRQELIKQGVLKLRDKVQ